MRAQEEHRGRAAARQLQVPHPSQNVVADMALARFNGRTRTPWELAEESDRQAALEQQVLGLGQVLISPLLSGFLLCMRRSSSAPAGPSTAPELLLGGSTKSSRCLRRRLRRRLPRQLRRRRQRRRKLQPRPRLPHRLSSRRRRPRCRPLASPARGVPCPKGPWGPCDPGALRPCPRTLGSRRQECRLGGYPRARGPRLAWGQGPGSRRQWVGCLLGAPLCPAPPRRQARLPRCSSPQ